MFIPPSEPFFCIFNFPIYYYGIIMAFAIFTGVVIANRVALKEYFLPNIIYNIATPTIIGGILGARLYYCLLDYSRYLNNPIEIFAFREGGLSIHGAILGGLIVLLWQAKKYNINFLKLCDIVSVGFPLGQAIGRWGNFFNSEAFGLPTTLPWGMYIKQPLRPEQYFANEYFHPTFFYESLLDIVIFVILYKIILKRHKDKSGVIFASYLILYSIVRFIIESLRIDCFRYIMGIPVPQIVSVFFLIIGLSIILYNRQKFS